MNDASALWDPIVVTHGGKADAERTAADAATTENTDQITERVRAEEAERAASITAACDLAGCPERAAGFIADRNKSLSDVLAILLRGKNRPKG